MKRNLALALTVGIIALIVLRGRRPTDTPDLPAEAKVVLTDNGPIDCVEAMFRAARQQQLEAYLDCFAGDERRRLEDQIADSSPSEFLRSLESSLRDLKGHAIFLAGKPVDSEPMLVTVERIYAERTERQDFELLPVGDAWKIVAVRGVQPYHPAKKYGTPVGFQIRNPNLDHAVPPVGHW